MCGEVRQILSRLHVGRLDIPFIHWCDTCILTCKTNSSAMLFRTFCRSQFLKSWRGSYWNLFILLKRGTYCTFMDWSAYEVNNSCCIFERLFKVKKRGIFSFRMSSFVLEIHALLFMFLHYANMESDDIINSSTESRISPEISEQGSSNFSPELHITKETVWHLLCCCRGNPLSSNLSEKSNIPIWNLFKWAVSCSEHTQFLYCLNSPH